MSIWDSISSLKFDQYGPVLLLFGIMGIFLCACIFHSIFHKKSEEEGFDNPPIITTVQSKVVLTDGNTGTERTADP